MDFKHIEEKMNKTISVLQENFSEVRAGRANPAILNKIKVDYYGTPTPINQVAGISVPEARLIVIQPWDASLLKEIEKEILKAEIGINPNNDRKVIRLAFPELNEERRKELVKEIKKTAEESKVAIRSIRREGIDEAKKMQKDSEITEDELKSAEDQIQKLTDSKIAEIDQVLAEKEILKAEIGINPNNDGKVIRLAFPELNEERRKEIVKDIKKMAEESKVSIRSVRREGIDEAKKAQKDSEITEDELKSAEDQIQKLTDSKIAEIDKVLAEKEKEVMSV